MHDYYDIQAIGGYNPASQCVGYLDVTIPFTGLSLRGRVISFVPLFSGLIRRTVDA